MLFLYKGAALVAAALMSGCSMLPVDGPAPRDIASNAVVHAAVDRRAVAYDYVLVDLSAPVLEQLAQINFTSIHSTFDVGMKGSSTQNVGVGDVIQISVFEASGGGLFRDDGGVKGEPFVALPALAVNSTGKVTVPYAGPVRVVGRTTREIEQDIESKLSARAIEPQVVVSLVEHHSAAVTVVGEGVSGANRIKLVGNGERILDLISRAGGSRFPSFELFVTLNRGNRQATVHFPRLIEDPRENVRVFPGDTIYVFRRQQKFVAVGALGLTGQTSGLTGQFPFEQDRLSLSEAIAKAGGLQDSRADPSQVFIYRQEHRETLERMGMNLSKLPPDQQWISVIYRANFRDPSSFIFASRFQMRNQDVIYAANSDATEVTKFLTYVRTITSTVSGVAGDVAITRDLASGRRLIP